MHFKELCLTSELEGMIVTTPVGYDNIAIIEKTRNHKPTLLGVYQELEKLGYNNIIFDMNGLPKEGVNNEEARKSFVDYFGSRFLDTSNNSTGRFINITPEEIGYGIIMKRYQPLLSENREAAIITLFNED